MRWALLVLGLAVLAVTTLSVVGTLVVPRAVDSRISRVADRLTDVAFRLVTLRVRGYQQRDRVLAWQAPTMLLARLALWIVLLLVGFALVLLPLVPGAMGHSFSEAGSSMFTLGYSAPTNTPSSVIDYVAAYTGLIVVALQIGYLPTIYSAFNRRETEVTLLISRAGLPAWGPELLARTRFGIEPDDIVPVLSDLFNTWERWAAELAESHTTYLVLVRLRSPRALSHWLTSLLAVLDAAALNLALNPDAQPRLPARLCLRMGFVALQQIGLTLRLPVVEDVDPDAPISVSRADFDTAVEMLRSVDFPVTADIEHAWIDFRGWRANYDTLALQIARLVDAPPALWSGPRRWPSDPTPPIRPANRRGRR